MSACVSVCDCVFAFVYAGGGPNYKYWFRYWGKALLFAPFAAELREVASSADSDWVGFLKIYDGRQR